jgi:hypothetical protein
MLRFGEKNNSSKITERALIKVSGDDLCPNSRTHPFEDARNSEIEALKFPLSRALELAFGENLIYGVIITFGNGRPEIHIRDTDVKPILASMRSRGHKILQSIKRYQEISGVTPSKTAFRVFALVLRKIIPADTSEYSEFKSLCEDALRIDLTTPANKSWNRELILTLHGTRVRVDLSIEPVSFFNRLLLRALPTDMPTHERDNMFTYRLKMSLEKPNEKIAFAEIKHIGRQVVAQIVKYYPVVVAEYFLSSFIIPLIPKSFSGQPAFVSSSLVAGHAATLAIIGVATLLLQLKYQDSKFRGKASETSRSPGKN